MAMHYSFIESSKPLHTSKSESMESTWTALSLFSISYLRKFSQSCWLDSPETWSNWLESQSSWLG